MTTPCQYCGFIHQGRVCHLIEEIEYFESGGVKRVKLRGESATAPMPNPPAGPIPMTPLTAFVIEPRADAFADLPHLSP